MKDINKLITDNIDIWSSAQLNANSSGRGANKKRNLIGIKKLRELILELAFSGKLVNSDEREDFEQTLSEINKQKIEFHSQKGVRVQAFKKLVDEPSNLLVPNNWKVCYLDQVVNYITDFQANGSFATIKKNVTYFDSPNYALLVRLTDLRHKLTDDSSYKYTDEHGYNFLSKSSVHGGELVVANVGAGVGTTLLVPEIDMPATLAPNMFMIVLPELVDKEYFLYFSQSPQYWSHINKVNTGTGQPKINKTEYKNCKFPLAPRNIQKLVVSKVKELMALCDQLEQQTEASIDAHQLLVAELLSTLTNIENAQAFEKNWARIAEHFDLLFTTEHSIEQLKQTILQLAVMGKLVPQNEEHVPGNVLIQEIRETKQKLIEKKVIKKQSFKLNFVEEKPSVPLPSNWEWSSISELAEINPKNESEDDSLASFIPMPLISTSYKGEHGQESRVWNEIKKGYTHFSDGDLALAKITPCFENSKAAVFSNLENGVGAGTTELHVARFIDKRINPLYALLFIKTPLFLETGKKYMTGSAGQKRVPKDFFATYPMPLPPSEEQILIVEKVDSLMSLCDMMKDLLSLANKTQIELSEAIVASALD